MVLDTSCLLAVLLDEPERRAFNERLADADRLRLSAANFVELSIVIEARRGAAGVLQLDAFLARAGIEIVPVDETQARTARQAFSRYGKGRHAAALNFGDCFAYALATELGEPLLFKGRDFGLTDVLVAG